MKKQTVENGSCNSNYAVNGFHDNEQASMMVSTLELIFPQQDYRETTPIGELL